MRLTRCLLRYGGTCLRFLANLHPDRACQTGTAKKHVSGVGFEPTPSIEDQKSHLIPYRGIRQGLESGALDHSANLTVLQAVPKCLITTTISDHQPDNTCTDR